MYKTYHEIELKFLIDNPRLVHMILKKHKAKFIGKVFEKTLRFDTPNNELEQMGKFLRIRTGFKNVITFKHKIKNRNFKEREEIELEIEDPIKMRQILENLGFTKVLIMEKYREKWWLNNTEIDIDKLPMGSFVEIEGKPREIRQVAKLLQLDFIKRITDNYWDLWAIFTRRNGIKSKNIVFNAVKDIKK